MKNIIYSHLFLSFVALFFFQNAVLPLLVPVKAPPIGKGRLTHWAFAVEYFVTVTFLLMPP